MSVFNLRNTMQQLEWKPGFTGVTFFHSSYTGLLELVSFIFPVTSQNRWSEQIQTIHESIDQSID